LEKPFAEQSRTRSFSNDELRLVIAALNQAPNQIAATWLMPFHTANRLRQTLKMQWSWIDFEKKYLILAERRELRQRRRGGSQGRAPFLRT
jgi:hypothetical protein